MTALYHDAMLRSEAECERLRVEVRALRDQLEAMGATPVAVLTRPQRRVERAWCWLMGRAGW